MTELNLVGRPLIQLKYQRSCEFSADLIKIMI